MRGTQGSFINRLIERLKRRLKLRKLKKQQIIEDKQILVKKEEERKKKNEEIIIYFVNKSKLKNNLKINNKIDKKTKKEINLSKQIKNNKINNENVIKIVPIPNEKKDITNNIKKRIIKLNDNKMINNDMNNKKIGIKQNINTNKIKEQNKVNIEEKPETVEANYKIKKHKKREKNVKEINVIKVKKGIKNNIKSSILIKEINKIISDNKKNLLFIKTQIDNIENEINNTNDINRIIALEKALNELKVKLEKIINEFYYIKNGKIDNLNYNKLQTIISDIRKINPDTNLDELISISKINLDYYADMTNTKINSDIVDNKIKYRKEEIKGKNNIINKEIKELDNLKKINSRLVEQIKKNREILKQFNEMVNNIKPEKIIEVKYKFLSNMFRNTANLFGTFFSIPFLARPSNIPLFAFGLFTLNNSIRNMRAINSKKEVVKYIPSGDYTNKILDYKNNFDSVVYLIHDSINQIDFFREEYVSNFGNYYDYSEYNENLQKIDSIRKKLIEQSNVIDKLKSNYNKLYDKNKEKVLSIKNME